MISISGNILRIWMYNTVLERMKLQQCFFLKKPSLVVMHIVGDASLLLLLAVNSFGGATGAHVHAYVCVCI